VLQTLEGKGLLKRDRGSGDKRLVVVTLTPKGRALMKKLFPDFNAHEQRVLGGFSEAEKKELTVALRKITAFTESQL
jgi:DNA-binding MarR family transcriptional regulator